MCTISINFPIVLSLLGRGDITAASSCPFHGAFGRNSKTKLKTCQHGGQYGWPTGSGTVRRGWYKGIPRLGCACTDGLNEARSICILYIYRYSAYVEVKWYRSLCKAESSPQVCKAKICFILRCCPKLLEMSWSNSEPKTFEQKRDHESWVQPRCIRNEAWFPGSRAVKEDGPLVVNWFM